MESAALQQTPEYAGILAARGVKTAQMPQDGTHLVQRGPIIAATRHGKQIDLDALRRQHPRRITILNPDDQTPDTLYDAGFRQIMTGAWMAEMDLKQPAQIHPKWRASLRHAQNSAIKTSHAVFTPRGAWILARDTAQQKAKRFRALPHLISSDWPKRRTHFAQAIIDNQTAAAVLFLQHENCVTYQIGWASPAGRAHCAHHLLLVQVREIFAQAGYHRLDLGTIYTVNAAGLARFKLRSGANYRQLGGTWAAWPLLR